MAALTCVAAAPSAIYEQGPAKIGNSHEFVVASAPSKRDFLVQVAAPVRALKPGEKAAVIYVLDGDSRSSTARGRQALATLRRPKAVPTRGQ